MKINYSVEIKERAQHLYCHCGHTLRTVSQLTGVNIRTLKDWSGKYGWAEKRNEYMRTLMETRTNIDLLRNRLVEHCLEYLNPKEAIALLALQSRAEKKYGEDWNGSNLLLAPGFPSGIANDQDAASALEKAYRTRLTLLSIFPGRLGASELRGLRDAMELADSLRKRGQPEEEPQYGLTDEVAEEIRRKILGIGD